MYMNLEHVYISPMLPKPGAWFD